jgi:hypothetical protein
MKYGFIIPGGDVKRFGEMAAIAEESGWDGVFLADGISVGYKPTEPIPFFDPWVALATMAVATKRVKLGTFITPVSRRRPWKLSRELTTLDELSDGRMILAVGLGAAADDGGFCRVGEKMELRTRAELLDEGLAIIDGLWKGKPVNFKGKHYTVDGLIMLPRPVQKPRIPVWVIGVWPKEKSMSRVLKWDGLIPQPYKATPADVMSAEQLKEIRDYVRERRGVKKPFDIVAGGMSSGKNKKKAIQQVKPYADAGATWWVESLWSFDSKKVIERMKQGPPPV